MATRSDAARTGGLSRQSPHVEAGTHAKISTGAAENKFGIAIADAIPAYERISRLPGLEIQGVAVHIGSQLTDLAPLEAAFTKVGTLIEALAPPATRSR